MNNLKSIVRDGLGSISRRTFDSWLLGGGGGGKDSRSQPSSSSAVVDDVVGDEEEGSSWRWLPPELLRDVVKRVEESEAAWPGRQHVVACASVCRSWRHMCKEIVAPPESTGKITFPISLKQDKFSRKMISGGREEYGVYCLICNASVASAIEGLTSARSSIQWHHRLGHLPIHRLRRVLLHILSITAHTCDAC